MRAIEFRGKRVDNCEWIFGDLIHYDNCFDGHRIAPVYGIDRLSKKVDPETIGQFIGLLDKTGQEIFEDDEVEVCGGEYYSNESITFDDEDWSFTGKIIFENVLWLVGDIAPTNCWIPVCDILNEELTIEIIGNIHDPNPITKEKRRDAMKERYGRLTKEQQERFWKFCPGTNIRGPTL